MGRKDAATRKSILHRQRFFQFKHEISKRSHWEVKGAPAAGERVRFLPARASLIHGSAAAASAFSSERLLKRSRQTRSTPLVSGQAEFSLQTRDAAAPAGPTRPGPAHLKAALYWSAGFTGLMSQVDGDLDRRNSALKPAFLERVETRPESWGNEPNRKRFRSSEAVDPSGAGSSTHWPPGQTEALHTLLSSAGINPPLQTQKPSSVRRQSLRLKKRSIPAAVRACRARSWAGRMVARPRGRQPHHRSGVNTLKGSY